MLELQGWEIALLAAAACVSISSLIRLMCVRRDQVTNELLEQAEAEQRRQQEAERRSKAKPRKAA